MYSSLAQLLGSHLLTAEVSEIFLESHCPSFAFLCAWSMHKATQETLEYQHFEDQTIVKSVN